MTVIKPIPVPISGETEDNFMSRCVSFMIDEGEEQEQAVDICSTQWSHIKTKDRLISDKIKKIGNNNIICK
jgi:hypothetical protein